MVSPEFKAAVEQKNPLLARIMIKDSFVIDPTFVQLDEMLSYARNYNIPGLFDAYDGGDLESDPLKWDNDTMNEELVQLVTNFSVVRIDHLRKVVARVLASKADRIKKRRIAESPWPTQPALPTQNHAVKRPSAEKGVERAAAQRRALKILEIEAKKIRKNISEYETTRRWKPGSISEMEQAAKRILKAVQSYKENS